MGWCYKVADTEGFVSLCLAQNRLSLKVASVLLPMMLYWTVDIGASAQTGSITLVGRSRAKVLFGTQQRKKILTGC